VYRVQRSLLEGKPGCGAEEHYRETVSCGFHVIIVFLWQVIRSAEQLSKIDPLLTVDFL
jgi:hypothetical protein